MRNFIIDGGIGVWFILLFGGATLVGAVLFVRRPDELRLASLRAMSITTLLSSLVGFIAGVAISFKGVARIPGVNDRWHLIALKGISEACACLILGLTLLTLAWLMIAIGLRRLAAKEAAGT